MQSNIVIFIIILITMGVIAISWAAVSCWRTRFKRELLITKQTTRQLRETRTPTATESILASSGTIEPRPNARNGRGRDTDEPAAEPLMTGAIQQNTSTATYVPVEQQRETNDVVFNTESAGPARVEQSRPEVSASKGSEWSSTTGNTGVSTEAPGGEWGGPAQTEPESQGSWGGQDVKPKAKTPDW